MFVTDYKRAKIKAKAYVMNIIRHILNVDVRFILSIFISVNKINFEINSN